MRIAICGIHIESSTLSLHKAGLPDFDLRRGHTLLDSLPVQEWLGDLSATVEWIPILHAVAGASGGPVEADIYDSFEQEILDGLRACGPLDGVYLPLHGAMSVIGREGAEERLIGRIKQVVGPDVVLAASMDPHGNFSREMAELLDFAACHRHSPHIDNEETRRRAVVNLVSIISSHTRPAKAWVRIPVLLPGEMTATIAEPGKSVFGSIQDSIRRHGAQDANLWTGFAWADEPRCSAAVLAIAPNADDALACAAEIAESYWSHRNDFQIVVDNVGRIEDAVSLLLKGAPTPLVISDSGDNVTAGATGDITYILNYLDSRKAELANQCILIAGLVDGNAVLKAQSAGAGAILDLAIGASVDDRFAPPVRREWKILSLITNGSDTTVGALLADGSIHVAVQTSRDPFVAADDAAFPSGFNASSAFIEFTSYDLVVVKNGYQFPSQLALAGTSFLAITPGGTDLDPGRISATRLHRPIFPLDHDFTPDLTPSSVTITADNVKEN